VKFYVMVLVYVLVVGFVCYVGLLVFFQTKRGVPVPPKGAAVLISGAGTGFGRLTSYEMAVKGYKVYAGVLSQAEGEKLLKDFKEKNLVGDITPVELDVTQEQQVQAVFKLLNKELGDQGLHMLVNNAGIGLGGPVELVPVEHFNRVIQINLVGHVRVTKEMFPLLRKAKHARIVNITSAAGKIAAPFMSAYSASKFGMEAFCDSLRREIPEFSVSAIGPGFAKTGIVQEGHNYLVDLVKNAPEEIQKYYETKIQKVNKQHENIWNTAMDPQVVVDQIIHALTSPNPKVRYAVGIQAKTLVFLCWFLPDRLIDFIIAKVA